MALQKQIRQNVSAPERFRDVTMHVHVADPSSGDNAGKLVVSFTQNNRGVGEPWSRSVLLAKPGVDPVGAQGDVPYTLVSKARQDKFRALARHLLEAALAMDSFTGTMDADPDEPALT